MKSYILLDVSHNANEVDSLLFESLCYEIKLVEVNQSFSSKLLVLGTCCGAEVIRHLPAKKISEVKECPSLTFL